MTLLRRIRAFGGISADSFKKRRPAAGARLSADPLVSDFIGKLQSQGMQVRRQDFPDEVHGTVMFPALFDALKHFYTRELS